MGITAATISDWPRWRRWAASGALATVPAGLAVAFIPHAAREPASWVVLGGLTAAAFGLGRPSVLAQVFSRAVTWLLFVPTAVATVALLVVSRRFEGGPSLVALASGAALLLARPALSTRQARAEFDPVAYRRWFLASATVSVAAAAVAGLAGLVSWLEHHLDFPTIAVFALSASFLASAVGVLRMRAWGVLLSGLTALLAVGAALFMRGDYAGFAWAAVPGMMFGYPVLASRFRREARLETQAVATKRASTQREDHRVRIAVAEDDVLDEHVSEPSPARALSAGSSRVV